MTAVRAEDPAATSSPVGATPTASSPLAAARPIAPRPGDSPSTRDGTTRPRGSSCAATQRRRCSPFACWTRIWANPTTSSASFASPRGRRRARRLHAAQRAQNIHRADPGDDPGHPRGRRRARRREADPTSAISPVQPARGGGGGGGDEARREGLRRDAARANTDDERRALAARLAASAAGAVAGGIEMVAKEASRRG